MSDFDHITGRQIAAGRALAGMGQSELAATAHVSVATLRRMEASEGPAAGLPNNVRAVRAALEAAGVEFLLGEASGTGVCIRQPSGAQSQAEAPNRAVLSNE